MFQNMLHFFSWCLKLVSFESELELIWTKKSSISQGFAIFFQMLDKPHNNLKLNQKQESKNTSWRLPNHCLTIALRLPLAVYVRYCPKKIRHFCLLYQLNFPQILVYGFNFNSLDDAQETANYYLQIFIGLNLIRTHYLWAVVRLFYIFKDRNAVPERAKCLKIKVSRRY